MTPTEQEPLPLTAEQITELYKPPFRYEMGYIFDADGHMVADDGNGIDACLRIRGWGLGYKKRGRELQDGVGHRIAEILTMYWTGPAPTPAPGPARLLGMYVSPTGRVTTKWLP